MEQPQKTKHKWFILFFAALLVLLSGSLALVYFQRLQLAEYFIDNFAEQNGFFDKKLKISHIGLIRTDIQDIWLGDDLNIVEMSLHYSLTGLIDKKIERISLSGVRIDISNPNEGALGKLMQMSQGEGSEQTSKLAVPTIYIADSIFKGTFDELSFQAPFNATLHPNLTAEIDTTIDIQYPPFEIQELTLSANLDKELASSDLNFELAVFKLPWLIPISIKGQTQLAKPNIKFSFQMKDEKNVINLSGNGRADMDKLSANIQTELTPISFRKGGLQPSVLSPKAKILEPLEAIIGAQAELNWQQGRPHIEAVINLIDYRLNLSKKLNNIQLMGNIAFTGNPVTQDILFNSENLRISHLKQEPMVYPVNIAMSGQLKDQKINLSATGSLAEKPYNTLLFIEAEHDLTKQAGQSKITTPLFDFQPNKFSFQDISANLDFFEKVTGKAKGQSNIRWNEQSFQSDGTIELDNLSIKTDTFNLENIRSKLQLSNLLPPQTEKPQIIELDKIVSGLSLEQPQLKFSMNGSKLIIHRFTGKFAGGDLVVADLEFNPNDKEHHVSLELHSLNLKELFSVIGLQGLTGQGYISGKLPMSFLKDELLVTNGVLSSTEAGILKFSSQKANEALGGAGEEVELLLQVLSNFHYKKLSLKINKEASKDALVSLHLEGNNPDVKDGHPFKLNINLEGNIDKLLGIVLEGYRLSDRAIRSIIGESQ